MTVFVLTVDQRHSRRSSDRVDELLGWLAARPGVLRGFERTAGDEVQGVMNDAAAVVDVVLALIRRGEWSVGIGAGPVEGRRILGRDEPPGAAAVAGHSESIDGLTCGQEVAADGEAVQSVAEGEREDAGRFRAEHRSVRDGPGPAEVA